MRQLSIPVLTMACTFLSFGQQSACTSCARYSSQRPSGIPCGRLERNQAWWWWWWRQYRLPPGKWKKLLAGTSTSSDFWADCQLVRRYPNEVNTPSNGALKTMAYLFKKVSEAVLNADTRLFCVLLDVCRSVQIHCWLHFLTVWLAWQQKMWSTG